MLFLEDGNHGFLTAKLIVKSLSNKQLGDPYTYTQLKMGSGGEAL